MISKSVVNMHRILKQTGGEMRPRISVHYKYDLSCGHSVTRPKRAGQPVPEHISCKECPTAGTK